jgi:alpha-tubulin suppressor-like RCC1 family protein
MMAVRLSVFPLVFLVGCSAAPAEGGAEGAESDTAEIYQGAVLPVAKLVAAGDSLSCAKVAGQGVKCWGGNSRGELGIGTTGGEFPAPQSIVSPGANVKSLDSESGSTCALLKGGELKCWGANFSGTLGTGDTVDTNAPTTAVPLPAPAREVAVGGLHVCARVEGGDVYCWGGNFNGQLGIGAEPGLTPLPTAPVNFGGRRATAIASGGVHACAILGNGTVRCWGENSAGQLGVAAGGIRSVPAEPVALGAKATAISAGQAHTCALLETGQVKCWGNNADGQLGIGAISVEQPPQLVVGLPGPVTAITNGGDHTCVLLADQRIACFGFSPSGQVGAPGFEFQFPSPVILDIEFPVASIDASFDHTCALSTTGDVKCWGANWGGKLGLACYPGCLDTFGQSPSQIPNVQF